MRAVSLWQPWASAVVLGYKRIETRKWSTPFRGTLAIHAAKKRDSITTQMENVARGELGLVLPDPLPRGGVIGLVDLVDIREMDEELIAAQTELELALGDWREGRFAWYFENPRPIVPWLEVRGYQRMWHLSELEALDVATFTQAVR